MKVALLVGSIARLVPSMTVRDIHDLSIAQWDAYTRAAQINIFENTIVLATTTSCGMNGAEELVSHMQDKQDALMYARDFDEDDTASEEEAVDRAMSSKFGKPIGASMGALAEAGIGIGPPIPTE